jgi:cellulose synthase/poly-beta-1,6-N-acetylglucosamine synthase-like glycosyltransferase
MSAHTASSPTPDRHSSNTVGGGMRQSFTRLLILLTALVSLRYFFWRIRETENPAALWFFYLFLIAEILNFADAALFYFTAWRPTRHKAPPQLPGRRVDVLITTCNEPVSLLRETVVCATGIRYPHKTYILDDGNSPEVRKLATEFGCVYLVRPDRTHAKAGNLNFGLEHSDGEFLVTLDADHVAMPDLIDRLIGFFSDPKVAIVQTSQDFYNLDSFQHLTEWESKYGWQQQELFFGVIQPGKDGYNAAFYCGSPAMLRRSALAEIGGFATGTITEDMHTGLRLQKEGWRVLYYNRTVARGLAPHTYPGFATQWLRWGRGAMQVLNAERPITGKGLSLGQRVCYFASFYFYWMSYQKLLFVLTPILCLLAGLFPLVADPTQFLIFFGPYFALNWLASSRLQGDLRSFLLSEQFNLVKMSVLMRSITGLFRTEEEFEVTPKAEAAAAGWAEVRLQSSLILLLLAAIAVGCVRLAAASTNFEAWAIGVNLLWAVFYVALSAPLVWRAIHQKELRSSYRFPRRLDVLARVGFLTARGKRTQGGAYARNLNRNGFSITCTSSIVPGTPVEIELKLAGQTIQAYGCVVRSQPLQVGGDTRYMNGIQFEQIAPTDQDEITRYLFWEVAPRHGNILRLTRQTQSASQVSEDVLVPRKLLQEKEARHES